MRPNVTLRTVKWVSGRRLHGSRMDEFGQSSTNPSNTGDIFQAPWAAASINFEDTGETVNFAFWSFVGCVEGAFIDTNKFPRPVKVGDEDIVATAWYFPGGGEPVTGLYIDAFDLNLGQFVDDDFVEVVSNPSLTPDANEKGFVPAAPNQDIRAFAAIHNVPFLRWLTFFTGPAEVSSRDLAVKPGVALAIYKTTKVSIPGIHPVDANHTWVSWGVTIDGGGPTGGGPVPPWSPLLHQLAAGLALADVASKVNQNLQSSVLEVAAKQVSMAAEAIKKEMLNSKKKIT